MKSFKYNLYNGVLTAASRNALKKFPSIPLTWEDLLMVAFENLKPTIDHIKVNYTTKDISNVLYTYIYRKLLCYCKEYSLKKHTVLNFSYSYNDELLIPNGEEEIERTLHKEDCKKFLKTLNQEERLILELFYLKNKSAIDIAKITNISVQKIIGFLDEIKYRAQKFFSFL
ncbi:sigma-70 family RNA polymerase sigma factor [Mycoplasma procyoni]|uniref:sigma-70 family RNA polymerase sigma factor n=1 Tax=Mycoplasma procyoni TaxID=568784 RepID=UPI00197BE3CB|nr:sigma-70 family RNA polymerase sigma factor [Mycoplasma procyoni]MBN3534467.1 sigma-70 family RNA polymerase sigma factor [Mycoplasma procyoni]